MTIRVADDVLGKIARQQNDLFRRVREGTLSANVVSTGLQALIEGWFPEGEFPSYPVTVEYELPVATMIWQGRYDRKNDQVTGENFPRTRFGIMYLDIVLVHFNRQISTKDTLAGLEKKGLRPADLRELLAFGIAYPQKQRAFPIVALGSVWQNRYGHYTVPCLSKCGPERVLDLSLIDLGWSEIYRFAAVSQ